MINISKIITTEDGLILSYHKVSQIELISEGTVVRLYVQSWVDTDRKAAGIPAALSWYSYINVSELNSSSNLLLDIGNTLTSYGELASGNVVLDATVSIEASKYNKNLEINRARLSSNRSTFVYSGKQIACDELSRGDMDGVTDTIALTGAFPVGWPGAWKAVDNTYVSIATVDDWKAFIAAMVAQGMTNFAKSQTLKAAVSAATTIEEVNLITWE